MASESKWEGEKQSEVLCHLAGRNTSNAIKKAIAIPPAKKGLFTDQRDNKIYKTVKIGTQTWMAENLNYECDGSK